MFFEIGLVFLTSKCDWPIATVQYNQYKLLYATILTGSSLDL